MKPHNVMVDEKDRTQLMDFGLAQRTDADSSMTTEGSILGTPAYMAPEQARGKISAVGPHSDQYSLGVILYELLTGKKPFSGPPHSVVMRVASPKVLPPTPTSLDPTIPPVLEMICLRAMQKNSRDRYPDCTALARDLDKYLTGDFDTLAVSALQPPAATASSTASSQRPFLPANLKPWVFGGAGLVSCLLLLFVLRSKPEPPVAAADSSSTAAISEEVVAVTNLPPQSPSPLPSTAAPPATETPDASSPIDWSRMELVKLNESGPLRGYIRNLAVTPDGSKVILNGSRTYLLDTAMADILFEFPQTDSYGAAISPDNKTAAILRSQPGSPPYPNHLTDLVFWSLESTPRFQSAITGIGGWFHQGSVVYSPTGATLATSERSGRLRVWQPPEGELLDVDVGSERGVLQYCSDGTLITTGRLRSDRYDAEGDVLTTYDTRNMCEKTCIVHSRDERLILMGDTTGRLWIFDRLSGVLVREVQAHQESLGSLDVFPDGRHVLAAGNDGTVRIFNLETGEEVFQQNLPYDLRNKVALLPDGLTLLATGRELQKNTRESNSSAEVEEQQIENASPQTVSMYRFQPRARTASSSSPPVAKQSPQASHWRPTPEQQAFLDEVAQRPVNEQAAAVAKKLQDINPGFDGQFTHKVEADQVTEFGVATVEITNIWPVRALPELKTLNCSGVGFSSSGKGKLDDLSPLAGMKLTRLTCNNTGIADLSPLSGMPLIRLACAHTRVSDLSPLAGMPLTYLFCHSTRVSDLSPVAGMPLIHLSCADTRVSDLSPLTGMSLTGLSCYRTLIPNFHPLAGMPLSSLHLSVPLFHTPDEQLVYGLPVRELSKSYSNEKRPTKEFWEEFAVTREAAETFATETARLSANEQVRAITAKLRATPNGTNIGFTPVIRNRAVLEAVVTLPSDAEDITPLRALTKLQKLTINGGPYWLDLSPLNNLPLEELTCGEDQALRNAPMLLELKTLKTINGKPTSEYLASLRR